MGGKGPGLCESPIIVLRSGSIPEACGRANLAVVQVHNNFFSGPPFEWAAGADADDMPWWTFRMFFIFSARGRGREGPRRRKGGGDFLWKIPGGGGLPGGGGRGARGREGVWGIWEGGGRLNIFFEDRKSHQACTQLRQEPCHCFLFFGGGISLFFLLQGFSLLFGAFPLFQGL